MHKRLRLLAPVYLGKSKFFSNAITLMQKECKVHNFAYLPSPVSLSARLK